MSDEFAEIEALLEKAAEGHGESWQELLEPHRHKLRKMVAIRMDARLQSRIDASDVVQESFLEAWNRLEEFLRDRKTSFFLWLRFLTGQKLVTLHRHHLGTHMRDADREVSLYRGALPEASSAMLAAQLLGGDPRPSEIAVRAEIKVRLQEALNQMDSIDREVLSLRHFEHLNREETAKVLGMQESATSKRYVRALRKLKAILNTMPGGMEELLG